MRRESVKKEGEGVVEAPIQGLKRKGGTVGGVKKGEGEDI